MKEKLAIITSGGGARCSWSVGVMLALAKEYNLTTPDLLISASGSAGTGAYFIARQYESIRHIWSSFLSTTKLINFLRFWRIVDIDYLIDEIFRNLDPLDEVKVKNSKTEFLIPALKKSNGQVVYFSNHSNVSIFEAMRATKAMPIAYTLPVKINGERYCDSPLTSAAKTHISKAIELGATKILVVDASYNKSTGRLYGALFNFWTLFRSNLFRKNYKKQVKNVNNYNTEKKVISIHYLRFPDNLKGSILDTSIIFLNEAIRIGYKSTKHDLALRKFLATK